MERLKRSFRNSFRRKKSLNQTESSKPHQWEGDEKAVRNGNCSFHVKYLGCVQVEDSRGMHICEHALLTLKSQKNKSLKGQLYVSGDGLRVVDDETKGLVVDQTIEKVSFCAPDRNHEKGFSYICRDGTTRRWMCHGFLATKDTGDRLSHAVGCAFSVCLERKQKRDSKLSETKNTKNNSNKTNSSLNSVGSSLNSSLNTETDKNSTKSFNRTGSFRRIPLVQRMKDPQECKTIEPLPIKEVHNPYAIERPHATPQLLERQGSCRIFKGLNQNSPFKRQLSLRLTTPSQLEKQRRNSLQQQNQETTVNKFGTLSCLINDNIENKANQSIKNVNIMNNSVLNNNNKQKNDDDLSAMCKYMVEGLSILSNKNDLFNDDFISNNSNCIDTSKSSKKNSDLLNDNSLFKTIINIDDNLKESKIKNENNFENKKNQENLKNDLKFGKLVSYSDDFFQSNQNVLNKKINDSSIKNGLLFTDLDEPFETNFDNNLVEKNYQTENISNNLKNSPLTSLSNSHNNDINKITCLNKKHSSNTTLNKKSLENSFNNDFAETFNNLNNNNISMTKNNKLKYQKDLFDPFDSEWVSLASRHKNDVNRNTNPFLQTAVKAFELKM